LISAHWEDNYPLTVVSALERGFSDQAPLIIDSGEPNKMPPIFRFENALLQRDGFDNIIEKIWNDASSFFWI
jgi:hypothetical protein